MRTPAQRDYTRLLTLLDEVASREVTAVLDELQVLTEPHVARTLAALLPSGGPGLQSAAVWQSGPCLNGLTRCQIQLQSWHLDVACLGPHGQG